MTTLESHFCVFVHARRILCDTVLSPFFSLSSITPISITECSSIPYNEYSTLLNFLLWHMLFSRFAKSFSIYIINYLCSSQKPK